MNRYEVIANKIAMKYRNLSRKMIIKDLLIDEIIKELIKIFNNLISNNSNFDWLLVGGTSLSKSYKEIKRISEDIDISILCKTKQNSKNIMKMILNNLFNLDNDNLLPFSFIDKDALSKDRKSNFKNFKIIYKEHEFDIDFKSLVNNEYYNPQEKEIMNVSHKILGLNQEDKLVIKIPDFKYIITEKFLAYQKMIKKGDITIRTWRHIFDIYSIFKEKLLDNTIENWRQINIIYNFIIDNYERDLIVKDIKNNIVFIDDLKEFDSNIQELQLFLQTECFKKYSVKKIIEFYKELINILNNI